MDSSNLSLTEPNGILGIVLSVAAAILYLRRKVSSDNNVINKESAETNIIALLQKERAEAMKAAAEAWASRTKDAETIARLTAAYDSCKAALQEAQENNAELSKDYRTLRQLLLRVAPDRASEILSSGFIALDDRESDG